MQAEGRSAGSVAFLKILAAAFFCRGFKRFLDGVERPMQIQRRCFFRKQAKALQDARSAREDTLVTNHRSCLPATMPGLCRSKIMLTLP